MLDQKYYEIFVEGCKDIGSFDKARRILYHPATTDNASIDTKDLCKTWEIYCNRQEKHESVNNAKSFLLTYDIFNVKMFTPLIADSQNEVRKRKKTSLSCKEDIQTLCKCTMHNQERAYGNIVKDGFNANDFRNLLQSTLLNI